MGAVSGEDLLYFLRELLGRSGDQPNGSSLLMCETTIWLHLQLCNLMNKVMCCVHISVLSLFYLYLCVRAGPVNMCLAQSSATVQLWPQV